MLRTIFLSLFTLSVFRSSGERSSIYRRKEHAYHIPSVLSFTYDRLDKANTVLLICDIEEGLYLVARDHQALAFRSNILAHAALGKIFDLPTVIASVGTTGTRAFLKPVFPGR